MSACEACLRRARLLGILGPWLEGLGGAGREARALLQLSNRDLARAVAGARAAEISAEVARCDVNALRAHATAAGLTAICRHEAERYPTTLRGIDDAPHALFVGGDAGLLAAVDETPSVAIVGGRRPSRYALEIAHELGRSLAVAGVPVVSGLALGVDAAAHRGALAGGGRPIAVLGCGADVPYPARHRELHAEIACTGAIVSELPPGTTARRWAFPARNRIMAGLAEMTVVVEARERSGSLITADFAQQIGREVGAVPGRVNARGAAGSNRLLADGAAVILRAEDVLDRIFHVGACRAAPPRVVLDPAGHAVLDAIEAGESPLTGHELPIRAVRSALGRLESLGLVRRDGLGGYERTGAPCERA